MRRNAFDVLMRRVVASGCGCAQSIEKAPISSLPLVRPPKGSDIHSVLGTEAARAPMSHVLMFDGGSRGNPGPCGAGAVIYYEGAEVWCGSLFVSELNTNNFAEYTALTIGLKEAARMRTPRLTVFGDSLLIVKQMTGLAKVRSPLLSPLYAEAKALTEEIGDVNYLHVKRRFNKRADQLANLAMDAHSLA